MSLQSCSRAGALLALVALSAAASACIGPNFPTAEQSLCTVAGITCQPECNPTLLPALAADTVRYHLGPASCAARDFDVARHQAESLCRQRGMAGTDAGSVTQQPPVPPLAPAAVATFACTP